MRKVLFLLFIFINPYLGYSSDLQWNMDPVVIKNGSNNNTIYDICYGRDGFIWISTDLGITRYDGFRFRDYPFISSLNSSSLLLPQAIKKLSEDADGLLYAHLYQGGLVCFDKEKEKFLPVRFNKPFKQRDILDFYRNEGVLYLATSTGLFEAKTICKEDEKGEFVYCTLNESPLINGQVRALCGDGKKKLYFSVDRTKVMQYDIATKKSNLIQKYDVVSRIFFENGHLWICRLWNDIIYHDLKTQKERVISMGAVGNVDYSNSYVSDLICQDKKTYYLTTWDGLFKLEFANEDISGSEFTLSHLTEHGQSFYAKVESKMTSILWDNKQKILWAGTFGGGLIKYDLSDSMYSRVQQNLNVRINGLAEDANKYVWLVMADGKILKSTTPEISVDTSFELWGKTSAFSGLHCIYKDKIGRLWLGNNQGEVVIINPLSGDVQSFRLQVNNQDIRTYIHQFCQDSRDRMWVATSDGLIQVNSEDYKCRKIEPKSAEIGHVFSVAEDKEGNIWIGTDKGLKRLEIVDDQISMKGDYEKENGLEDTAVQTIYVNNYNQIYVAYLNVVARIDGRNENAFESIYTLQKGLTNGHICCMIDDQIGNTWAGNNNGVMTIRNGQDAFYNYLSIGNCNAVCRLNDGKLLWSNSWGLIFFDPVVTKTDSGKSRLMLTDVEVNRERILAGEKRNGQIILSVSPEKQEKLVFNADNNDFRLYFSDLRYAMNQRKIAYRLLPDDEEWHMKPLVEGIWFNKLSAGNYTLQVKPVFPDGKEGEVIQISIVVKDVWYRTIWAYLIYILLLLVFSYYTYRFYEKKDIRRQMLRDREIVLKENLNLEKVKQQQKQEIELIRTRLLVLFVQELRTPLSLIIGPLKDLLKDKTLAPNFISRGQVAYRNSLRMLDACKQIMAIYSQDNLSDKLRIASYQIEKLVDNNLFDVREILEVNSINFKYEKRIKKDMELYTDKNKLEFIIHYLLTGAFAHINYAGNVSLIIAEMLQNNIHYLSIVIEDDGKTIVKSIEELLDKDSMSDNNIAITSTDLGFSALNRIVEMLHGTVTLDSDKESGTKFTVNLPIEKKNFEQDPNVEFVEPEQLEDNSEFEYQGQAKTGVSDTGNFIQQNSPMSLETVIPEEVNTSISKGPKKTILIVEDHKDICLYLKVLFGKEYNLVIATNGQEGVDMAFRDLPDLIICDVMMPIKDGFECCREVKENPDTCSIPFIILTAKVEDDDVVHGLELGADDYVLKPFTPSILKAKVRSLINGRQALKQMYTKLLMLPGTDTTATTDVENTSGEGRKVEDLFISSVIKIVEENIAEADFSVKKLASDMNMSQPTLYRKVKQSTDYTIIELIRGVRMRRAAVLLKTKQYAVQEVAEMVGYNDIPTFRKHFVDAFGTTPSTYE